MQELFGISMNVYMVVLLAIFLATMAVVLVLAWRNPIMVKLGLRNLLRRRVQTILIIIGIMLSSVITAAAFSTGDTISYSIRSEAVEILGPIDEIIVPARATSEDRFGSNPYISYQRFEQLKSDLTGLDSIDGLSPGIGETVPASNLRTSLSEGRMRVAGVDPLHLRGFGALTFTSGGEARLEALAQDEGYINEKAAEELDAAAGDQLRLILSGQPVFIKVKGVVERGGLAGDTSTLILPLPRVQELFDRAGQINSMVVSNRGNEMSGANLSEEVTRELRVLFADETVASGLGELLARDDVLEALEKKQSSLRGTLRQDVVQLRDELQRAPVSEQLISLLADEEVEDQVLDAIEGIVRRAEAQQALDLDEIKGVERDAITLFADLGEFRVIDIKRRVLDAADEVGSFVTTFFIIMGLFSIIVGVLLIFLIFVMLAAARRSEMGMARAVGAKRRHLVQMFLFEGTAYSLVSSAIGVLLGLAVSALIVVIANRIFAGASGGGNGPPEDFQMTFHPEVRSIIVAYCLGMIIVFATVTVSAYQVSRLNIVAAVRGLPAPVTVSTTRWRDILATPWRVFLRPFLLGRQTVVALATFHPRPAMTYMLQMPLAILSFPIALIGSIFQMLWRPFTQGWLAFLLGLLITWSGMASDQAAPFRIGVSLMIVGIGLTLRTVLRRTAMRVEVRDRIAYTFAGVVMLIFWVMPFNTLRAVAGDLNADFEMFFVSGISMVAAAVWTVMYNADLLLRALTFFTGRIGKLGPVLVTAMAYPMSAKFRTGLTLAMFALVIFTLMVMSILTEAFDTSTVDQNIVTGGWDIEGNLNFNTPIMDIYQAIDEEPELHIEDFDAIGGYTTIGIQARQVGAESQRWRRYAIRAANDDFLEATEYKLRLIADDYGPTDRDVWQALKNDPSLAVVEAAVVPNRSGFDDSQAPFRLEGFYYQDDRMSPIDIEVREPGTGAIVQLTVIGVLDQLADSFGSLAFGMFTSKANLDDALPFPVPITTYRFRTAEGVDVERAARSLEATLQENGMETEVLIDLIDEQASAQRAFNRLFTGFMGLGLLVGIAALGVISLRAVVERRQQIGVLRAIGYRRSMIQLSFLLESSFVALLGIAIGVILGTIISYNIVNDVREREGIESLRFSIPWLQITAIIVVAYLFSLATTLFPARQASRIYPAEALRYE